jgi:hypothetical protein
MLNGNRGDRICHARGLQEGDPLSLMLFLLAMEVLNALFRRADACCFSGRSVLKGFGIGRLCTRDDLVIFVMPHAIDLQLLCGILSTFEEALGLACNIAKCQMTPI